MPHVSLTAWGVRTHARAGGEAGVRAGVARGWLRVRANPPLDVRANVALACVHSSSRLRRNAHMSTATPPHCHLQPEYTAPYAPPHPQTSVRIGGGHANTDGPAPFSGNLYDL